MSTVFDYFEELQVEVEYLPTLGAPLRATEGIELYNTGFVPKPQKGLGFRGRYLIPGPERLRVTAKNIIRNPLATPYHLSVARRYLDGKESLSVDVIRIAQILVRKEPL